MACRRRDMILYSDKRRAALVNVPRTQLVWQRSIVWADAIGAQPGDVRIAPLSGQDGQHQGAQYVALGWASWGRCSSRGSAAPSPGTGRWPARGRQGMPAGRCRWRWPSDPIARECAHRACPPPWPARPAFAEPRHVFLLHPLGDLLERLQVGLESSFARASRGATAGNRINGLKSPGCGAIPVAIAGMEKGPLGPFFNDLQTPLDVCSS